MTKNIIIAAALAVGSLSLSSCVWQIVTSTMVRPEYPGTRPPHVIADIGGKPASNKWVSVNPDDLPPPSSFSPHRIDKAPDGTLYGEASRYSDIVLSPHAPYYLLDCRGCRPGDRVWDPYTRKPFTMPRAYTFN